MSEDLSPLHAPEFQEPIAKLETFLSQSRRAFLLGAGCSKIAGLPLTAELTDLVLAKENLSHKTKIVLTALRENFGQSTESNIEDYMSELVDLISISERRHQRAPDNSFVLLGNTSYDSKDLKIVLEELKQAIADTLTEAQEPEIGAHREFIRVIHGTLKAGRLLSVAPVDYFVLNYDTLIEDSLALERITFTDGFWGGVTGWWEPSLFDSNVHARVLKLHGSIDWCRLNDSLLPRRVRSGIQGASPLEKVLIWPAATKHRETQRDPYAQLISLMRQVLRPEAGAEIVLAICGYSFGDTHINVEIDRALRESEEQLTVVAFTGNDCPDGQLKTWLEDAAIQDQVRVYAKRGFFHGKEARTSSVDLPWWKFEVLTRILEERGNHASKES